MYEIKHCIVESAFYYFCPSLECSCVRVQIITACIFLVFSKIIIFPGGGGRGNPDVSKGYFYAIDIFVPMCFCCLGNLACLTDNCVLGLVRTCLINWDWLFSEFSKGDWR